MGTNKTGAASDDIIPCFLHFSVCQDKSSAKSWYDCLQEKQIENKPMSWLSSAISNFLSKSLCIQWQQIAIVFILYTILIANYIRWYNSFSITIASSTTIDNLS